MNYRKDMETSVQYIGDHLQSNLSAQIIADRIGYSVYHFSRIFLASYGMTVMEYVRSRRMSVAAHSIYQGSKTIDAALNFGFDTPSGFSKAFRRQYHCTPTEYIENMKEGIILLGKWGDDEYAFGNEDSDGINNGERTLAQMIGENARIVERDAFFVVGFPSKSNLELNMKIGDNLKTDIKPSSTQQVAAMWDEVEHDEPEANLYRILNPPSHGEVGVFVPDALGNPTYVLGVIVNDFNKATKDMICLTIPKARYAVFTTPQIDYQNEPDSFVAAIKVTWKVIFDGWLERNGYQYDEEKMDFEFYDERCHSPIDPIMEIWVPIK